MTDNKPKPRRLISDFDLCMTNEFDENHRDQLAMIGAAFVAGMRSSGENLQYQGISYEPEEVTCIHKIPSMPLLLDGKPVPPEAVKDFDGKVLYYIIEDSVKNEELLPVFSDQDKAMQHIASLPPKKIIESTAQEVVPTTRKLRSWTDLNTNSSADDIAEVMGGAVFLYKHIIYGGDRWTFNTGFTGYPDHQPGDGNIPDFRKVSCFLWWCKNINDQVSSVINSSSVWAYVRPFRSWAVLYQHINYQGSQLWILENNRVPDLSKYGWNDIASSMSYRITI